MAGRINEKNNNWLEGWIVRRIDLHTHSTCSDGSYSVHELIDYAHEKELAAIALTDHDTSDGVEEAVRYGKEK